MTKSITYRVCPDHGISAVRFREANSQLGLACGCLVKIPMNEKLAELEPIKIQLGELNYYPYQREGIEFLIRKAKGRGILLDEQGLGKTIQAYGFIKHTRPFSMPALIVCNKSLQVQWFRAALDWLHMDCVPEFLFKAGQHIPPANVYITSYSHLGKVCDELHKQGIVLNTIILDEFQNIKNQETQRYQNLMTLIQNNGAEFDEDGDRTKIGGVRFVIGLSGTPYKNRALEFFNMLNLVQPGMFYDPERYRDDWVDEYVDGRGKVKLGGIRRPHLFRDMTKDFILRRERDEVAPDLPKVRRDNQFIDMGNDHKEHYLAVMGAMLRAHQEQERKAAQQGKEVNEFERQRSIIGYLVKLRHITGVAKIEFAVDYIKEFVESHDNTKLTIYSQHDNVHLGIRRWLDRLGIGYMEMAAWMNTRQIEAVKDEFNSPDMSRPILLTKTQIAKEGHNLQYMCHNCLHVERQWTSVDEEQAETRFTRTGSQQMKGYVDSVYLIAAGTIDEWLTELVEQKRQHTDISGNAADWQDSDALNQLFDVLIQKGLPKWTF